MLHSTAELARLSIHATDGTIGSLENLYFDDIQWRVRYLVVDTGHWLPGRLVLIGPSSVERTDLPGRQLHVKLSKQQVADSPGIETHETVSRQHELHMARYYGWPVYWSADNPAAPDADDASDGDSNLRSVSEVRSYAVHATDGDLGHVADFLVDDTAWEIRYLIVDTGRWLPGRKVLIDPRTAEQVDWAKSTVRVRLTKSELEQSPAYDPSGAREQQDKAHLEQYKKWPTYWY